MIYKIYYALTRQKWQLGFANGGMTELFSSNPTQFNWVVNPFRDRWFADPFILEITNDHIYLLAEEYRYSEKNGRITKLTINRQSLYIEKTDILLDLPFHLSFPNILRVCGKIYVYPENTDAGKLDLYVFDDQCKHLDFVQTICDDVVWDSSITCLFGRPLLFTACKDDYHLDIYEWDAEQSKFIFFQSILSDFPSSRLAGQLFEYEGSVYCPFQDCSRTYGGAVILKEVSYVDGQFSFTDVKKFESTHKRLREGLHTLNVYNDTIVIDVKGYCIPIVGKYLHKIGKVLGNQSQKTMQPEIKNTSERKK